MNFPSRTTPQPPSATVDKCRSTFVSGTRAYATNTATSGRRCTRRPRTPGELREDLDVRATRMLVMGGALNWAAEWWNPKRGGSLTSLVRTAQSIVLHGIASPAALAGTVADTSSAPAPREVEH